jgi:hypothetical protein
MQKFIYVFDDKARDTLLGMGYELLKNDGNKKMYVFVNKEPSDLRYACVEHALSDTLTF